MALNYTFSLLSSNSLFLSFLVWFCEGKKDIGGSREEWGAKAFVDSLTYVRKLVAWLELKMVGICAIGLNLSKLWILETPIHGSHSRPLMTDMDG